MKATCKLMIGAIALLTACQSKSTRTQNFIPGIYINSAKGEYAIADDTLVITQQSGNTYLITRKTTYQAIRDGKLLPKHHKVEKLNAVYDTQKQELDEATTGRIFHFDPDNRLLLINQVRYHKLN